MKIELEGLENVDPALMADYEEAMRLAIPQIVADVNRRVALAAEARTRVMEEPEPEKDKSSGLTTDRNSPCLRKILPSGQQKCYLVLSEEERAKGFVRPVRQTYRHLACGFTTTMGLAIAETYARNPAFYGGTFCCTCGKHFPLRDPETGAHNFEWVMRRNDDPGGPVGD